MADDQFVGPIEPQGPTQFQFFRYPQNLGQPPFDKWIRFNAKSGRHIVRNLPQAEGNPPDRTLASVGLYLSEDALISNILVDWATTDLGPFAGAALELFAQTGQNFLGVNLSSTGLVDNLKAGLNSLKNLVTGIGNNGIQGYGALTEQVIREQLIVDLNTITGGYAEVIAGARPNPRTDILFKSQQYRTHILSFLMVPRSLAEARQIDHIIHFFQFYMLPAYLQTEIEQKLKIGAFLIGYPYEFTIEMLDGNSQSMEHINKIGRSILTSVGIDHAAGKKTAFVKDNGEFYPVATSIRLCFQEVRLLARDSEEINRAGIDQQSLEAKTT